ncbi:MAG: choice-of-anchor B family protein, partial [Saprospiraceae bacterium]
MRFLFLALFLAISTISFGQDQQPDYNLELKSTKFYPEGLSGIWNYVAPDGHEYAVVGTQTATSIIDLKDPENPLEIANFPGSNNSWREARYWGSFIYVTTEAKDGLLIIDMSDPSAPTGNFWKPLLIVNGNEEQFETCHSINMDEKGIMALNGTNINGGTALLFDVNTTPGAPIYLGTLSPPQYTHDSYMQDDVLYTFDILDGVFRVFNAKNPADPELLAVQETSFAFTHNGWTSDDGHYLFTTDERANAYVDSYDISDLTDIKKLDVFRSVATEGKGVIPHNTYWRDGYLITSYYTDGVKVIDAHKPDNLIEVGSYDTYKGADGGFHGAWGVCPFFPSGLIVVSDIENGLFVLQPSYIRACYLEGKVSDTDANLLPQVDVKIISPIFNKSETDAQGEYRTGIADAGAYMVTYSKEGYYPQTLPVQLENGQVTIQDVILQKIPLLNFNGLATIKTIGGGVPEAQIALSGEYGEFYATADQEGIFTFSLYPGKYHLIAGAWGYLYNEIDSIEFDAEHTSFSIELEKGYQDDFVFDFQWTVTGTAETGLWERG